ncbi:hypothetical protein FQZ97_866380 [compost metagenome]
MDATDAAGARSQRTDCRDPGHGRHRRQLRHPDQTPARPPGHTAQRTGQMQPEGHRPRAQRARLARQHQGPAERWSAHHPGQIRLPRCRRCRPAVAADVRHSRRQRLRRFPGERPVVALRQPRSGQTARSQGLQPGRSGFAADVGTAPRHPRGRRQEIPAVRALRRLLDQIPAPRLLARSAAVDPPRQHRPDARGRTRQLRTDPLPDQGSDAVR